MFAYILLAALMILGMVRCNENSQENARKCFKHMDREELEEAEFIPNQEQLASICPKALKFLECEEQRILQSNPESRESREILLIKNVITELCNEDSDLHEGYLASVTCFRNASGLYQSCHTDGNYAYIDYQSFVENSSTEVENENQDETDFTVENENQDETDFTEEEFRELMCIVDAYAVACVGVEIQKCSNEAHETFVELLERSKYLTRHCEKEEAITKLRTDFADFLELEQKRPHMDAIRAVFNSFKK